MASAQSYSHFKKKIFSVTASGFFDLASEVYEFQRSHNTIFRSFGQNLHQNSLAQALPFHFLPVEAFKRYAVLTTARPAQLYFETSGTSGLTQGRHYVSAPAYYDESISKGFEWAFGPIEDCIIAGLLPSYLERPHASLVYMVRKLMELSGQAEEYFFMSDMARLDSCLEKLFPSGKRIVLFGVSFALLDWAATTRLDDFHQLHIIETGGMKGRRREMVKDELHTVLRTALPGVHLYSEYGMTELLSQAYTAGDLRFICPPWMKVMAREVYDPFAPCPPGQSGIIQIIDLANLYSCAFIETADLGRVFEDGSFTIEGRIDHSDIRGCNLLYEG